MSMNTNKYISIECMIFKLNSYINSCRNYLCNLSNPTKDINLDQNIKQLICDKKMKFYSYFGIPIPILIMIDI
jgi:hypothetical protein